MGVLVVLVVTGFGAQLLQRERADRAAQAAQDQIDLTARPGRTSLGAGGNFFVTAQVTNDGPDLVQAVDSRWHGIGLEAVTEIGGLGPIAPGTSASFVARVAPDCALVRSTPGVLAGRFDLVFQAPSGRRREVRLQLDRELELLGTSRAACADAAQTPMSIRPPRLLRVSATQIDLGLRLPDIGGPRIFVALRTYAGALLVASPAFTVASGRGTGEWRAGGWRPNEWRPNEWRPGEWQPGEWQFAVRTKDLTAAACQASGPAQRRQPMIVTVRPAGGQRGSLAVTLDPVAQTALLRLLASGCPPEVNP